MKKVLFYLALIQVVNPNIPLKNEYSSRSYIVLDGHSGEILEGKDYHLKRSVASISKIMTAIIALESDKLFYAYTVKEDVINVEGSSVYLKLNEQYRLIDLVYGLMLRSGNDAAYAISSFVYNDNDKFVLKMNEKAQEIGMRNTFFNNPCGLDIDDEGNISTSYDMALLMKYCLKNRLFNEVISTKEYHFNGHVYINKNKLLKNYEYLLGGKTGFTHKARRTLVTAAEKDNQKLIVVTLDCGDDFAFHKELYESYFSKYQYIVFLNEGLNYFDEYVFVTDRLIGMRIEKKISLKGTKKYYINIYTHKLKISFVDNQNIEYFGGEFESVKFDIR